MLGRLIEELALKTKARILIFDPNSDFIRLREVDSSVWADSKLEQWFFPDERNASFSAIWTAIPTTIASNRNLDEARRLVLDWGRLESLEMAAILDIDMNENSDLYSCLRLARQVAHETWDETDEDTYDFDHFRRQSDEILTFMQTGHGPPVVRDSPMAQTLRASVGSQTASKFNDRVVHLMRYTIWRSTGDGQTDVRNLIEGEDAPRVLVVDLQSLENTEERIFVADMLLATLWRRGRLEHWESIRDFTLPDARVPTFVVIDEAHNLVPVEKESPAIKKLSTQLVRVAAEGRKYGLYLIVSTQRPRKVDANVLTECDNLFLMRMVNEADLQYARETFGFLDEDAVQQAKSLGTGDLILLGGVSAGDARIHVSPRRTVQGGRGISETYWLDP